MTTPLEVDNQLHDMMRSCHNTMRQLFMAQGMFNGQPPMLFIIGESPGITQKDLAARMRITPASVATSIKRMEDEGLVTRTTDSNDARVLHLHLTNKGIELDESCRKTRDWLSQRLYQQFSEDDLRQFSIYIARMKAEIDCLQEIHNLQSLSCSERKATDENQA